MSILTDFNIVPLDPDKPSLDLSTVDPKLSLALYPVPAYADYLERDVNISLQGTHAHNYQVSHSYDPITNRISLNVRPLNLANADIDDQVMANTAYDSDGHTFIRNFPISIIGTREATSGTVSGPDEVRVGERGTFRLDNLYPEGSVHPRNGYFKILSGKGEADISPDGELVGLGVGSLLVTYINDNFTALTKQVDIIPSSLTASDVIVNGKKGPAITLTPADIHAMPSDISVVNTINGKSGDVILESYTKGEIDSELSAKADKSDVYTKSEIDLAKANKADVYTRTVVDNKLDLKADKSTVYVKSEVDTKIADLTQAHGELLAKKADKDSTYTKPEVNTLLDQKVDKSNLSDIAQSVQEAKDAAAASKVSETNSHNSETLANQYARNAESYKNSASTSEGNAARSAQQSEASSIKSEDQATISTTKATESETQATRSTTQANRAQAIADTLNDTFRNKGRFDPSTGSYPTPSPLSIPQAWISTNGGVIKGITWTPGDLLLYIPNQSDPTQVGTFARIGGELAVSGPSEPITFPDDIIMNIGKGIKYHPTEAGGTPINVLTFDGTKVEIGDVSHLAVGSSVPFFVNIHNANEMFAIEEYNPDGTPKTQYALLTEKNAYDKGQVDSVINTLKSDLAEAVLLTGDQTIDGIKTFSSDVIFNDNATDTMKIDQTAHTVSLRDPRALSTQGTDPSSLVRKDYIEGIFASKSDIPNWTTLSGKPSNIATIGDSGTDVYTRDQSDSIKSDLETQINGRALLAHTHTEAQITGLDKYTKAEVDAKLADKANLTSVVTKDSDTGAANIPHGTTAQAGSPDLGKFRINSETLKAEFGTGAKWEEVGSGGQHVFVTKEFPVTKGTANPVFNVSYDQGILNVYINGVLLSVKEFTADNGTSVTINKTFLKDSLITVEAFSAVNIANLDSDSINYRSSTVQDALDSYKVGNQSFVYSDTTGELTSQTIVHPDGNEVITYTYTDGNLTKATSVYRNVTTTTTYNYVNGNLTGVTIS